jgi:hypothetical protein
MGYVRNDVAHLAFWNMVLPTLEFVYPAGSLSSKFAGRALGPAVLQTEMPEGHDERLRVHISRRRQGAKQLSSA